jgi:hypothetical protein
VVVPGAHEVTGELDAVGGFEFPVLAVKGAAEMGSGNGVRVQILTKCTSSLLFQHASGSVSGLVPNNRH